MCCEIFALLRALKRFYCGRPRGARPFSFEILREFVGSDWKWPRGRGNPQRAMDVFSDVRETSGWKESKFKAGASEVLLVYPLIRHFLDVVVPADVLVRERTSFNLCCEVVDLTQCVKLRGMRHMPELKRQINAFLKSHVEAYAQEFVIPKHHYMCHMTRQAEEDGVWLDCFVHERKHQVTKDCSESIKNTVDFEGSVLTTVVHATIERLRHSVAPDELLEPTAPCQELSDAFHVPCRVSNWMRFQFVRIAVGDLLFCGEGACLVEACVTSGEEFALLVEPLALIERPSRTTSRWGRSRAKEMLRLAPGLTHHAACWHMRSDATILALGR